MSGGVNPYQPVEIPDDTIGDDATSSASFSLTRSQCREAEEQYLLRIHLVRLSLGSIALILTSLIAIGWSVRLGVPTFLFTVFVSMTVSTLVYLALVHRSKMLIRNRLPEFGLVAGAWCDVRSEPDYFVLISPSGRYEWPVKSLRTHAVGGGLLVCPEPMLYVFVPRTSHFRDEDYKRFRKRLKTRAHSLPP